MIINKGNGYSKRVKKIISKYKDTDNPINATYNFLKEVLNPNPERYDMIYRFDHSLRVAYRGKQIAEGEDWDIEPLVIACLLHDVGYPECKTLEELSNHPKISAEIARDFLKTIHYDEKLIEEMCYAILIHDMFFDIPENATPFALSVRDADDLDRFDIIRGILTANNAIGENNADDISVNCDKQLERIKSLYERKSGTDTAYKLWIENLKKREYLYSALKEQVNNTFNISIE